MEAKDFPNIGRVVFDDFVRYGEFLKIPVENLHTNTMADSDPVAYDVACEWIDKHGDELFPD